MKRIYALMDGHIADLRTARQRVLEIEKKAHDAKSDRLDRSVKAYASAVTAAIPGADVSFGDITLRDDVLLIEMKVAVPADQWLDRRGLLDREMMAHEIVRRIDPDVLGMLALRFEPVRDAA